MTDSVVRNYNRRAQSALKNTVWSGGCNAWYNNGNAVTAMHPGSVLHFKGNAKFQYLRPLRAIITYYVSKLTNQYRGHFGNLRRAF